MLHSLFSSLSARIGRPVWEKTADGIRFGWDFSDLEPDDVELSASVKSTNVDAKVSITFGHDEPTS